MNPNWIPVIGGPFAEPLSQLQQRIGNNQQVEQQNYLNQINAIQDYNRMAAAEQARMENQALNQQSRADQWQQWRESQAASTQARQAEAQRRAYEFEANRKASEEAARAQAQQFGQSHGLQQEIQSFNVGQKLEAKRKQELEDIRGEYWNAGKAAIRNNASDDVFNNTIKNLPPQDQQALTIEREGTKANLRAAWENQMAALEQVNASIDAFAKAKLDPKTGKVITPALTAQQVRDKILTDPKNREIRSRIEKYGLHFDEQTGRYYTKTPDPTKMWAPAGQGGEVPGYVPETAAAVTPATALPQQQGWTPSWVSGFKRALAPAAFGASFVSPVGAPAARFLWDSRMGTRNQTAAPVAAPVANEPGYADERGGWIPQTNAVPNVRFADPNSAPVVAYNPTNDALIPVQQPAQSFQASRPQFGGLAQSPVWQPSVMLGQPESAPAMPATVPVQNQMAPTNAPAWSAPVAQAAIQPQIPAAPLEAVFKPDWERARYDVPAKAPVNPANRIPGRVYWVNGQKMMWTPNGWISQ